MAERKPSGFRFRLPWLLQPALTSRPVIAPDPPRTTTQRPPFRPPGIAPLAPVAPPPPPTLATSSPPPPASPTRDPPRSAPLQVAVTSSPPRVTAKSSPRKSENSKIVDPLANQPTKETKTTSKTGGDGGTQPTKETPAAISPVTPLAVDKAADAIKTQTTNETPSPVVPLSAAGTADGGGTQPTKETPPATSPVTPLAVDKVADAIKNQTTNETPSPVVPLAAAGTADGGGTQPTKETQAAIEMANPATPPAIAKAFNTTETQPTKETLTTTGTKPTTIETPAPATPPRSPPLRPPPSPVNIQPLHTDISPKSPSRLASHPTDKPSSQPSSSSITTSAVPHNTPEIKRSTDSDHESKPKDIAKAKAKAKEKQIKSLNPHSMDKITETKSQKPKPITASDRVSLHREIKDDIFKFIRKMATSSPKQYTDEKPASVVTVAGDNTGASMHLGSDAIKREHEVNSDRSAAINEDGSSKSIENDQETKAIVNSNIQGINNSMMFNSSITERNAGVHLRFSHNIANNNDSKTENRELMETHRAEANMTPQQTLVYDPTIERGILEGVSKEMELQSDDEFKGYEIEVV